MPFQPPDVLPQKLRFSSVRTTWIFPEQIFLIFSYLPGLYLKRFGVDVRETPLSKIKVIRVAAKAPPNPKAQYMAKRTPTLSDETIWPLKNIL